MGNASCNEYLVALYSNMVITLVMFEAFGYDSANSWFLNYRLKHSGSHSIHTYTSCMYVNILTCKNGRNKYKLFPSFSNCGDPCYSHTHTHTATQQQTAKSYRREPGYISGNQTQYTPLATAYIRSIHCEGRIHSHGQVHVW